MIVAAGAATTMLNPANEISAKKRTRDNGRLSAIAAP
jgi:hypothetical protein